MVEQEKAYFVGGVNGVGKSALIEGLTKQHSDFEVFPSSDRLMAWLGIEVGDYEALRKFPEDLKRAEFNRLMTNVLSRREWTKKVLVVSAHFWNYKGGNLIDATGEWMSFLDALFVVTAKPETILAHLEGDEERAGKTRDLFTVGILRGEKIAMLRYYLARTMDKASDVSSRYLIPLFVINNEQAGINHAIRQFLDFDAKIRRKD